MPRLPFLAALFASVIAAHAAEPHPSLPPPVIPECLGVNIHFTDPKPGELEMIAAAGFKWVRMDFGWAGIERVKGEYDFSAYDRLAAALDKFKMRAVFILDYGNPLYANPGDTQPFTSRANTPEFREAFGKWAVAAVRHFKGRGYLWEMWNEPNGGFWKSADKTGDYIALAKATGEALRQAGLLRVRNAEVGMRNDSAVGASSDSALRTPNSAFGEALIGPATSTIDLPYLEACFKAGLLDYWDAVSVHPYRQSAPETVEDEYRSLRLLIRQYAPKDKVIPIISGEWGYSSAWGSLGKDEAARAELQGKYLPREFLTNIANDVALSIWYDWHDDGTDPKEGEHRFGIVSNEYHAGRDPVYDPKPAYTAMQALTQQLGGFRFNKREGIGEFDFTLLFEKGQAIRVAYWNSKGWIGGAPDLVRDDGAFDIFDWLGKKIDFVPGKPGSHQIFGHLNYLSPLDPLDVRHFQFLAAVPRLPLEYYVHVPQDLIVEGTLRNPFAEPLTLDLETHIPSLETLPEDAAIADSKTPPRFTLSGHGTMTERRTFRVDNPRSPHPLQQVFLTPRNAPDAWGVYQRVPVIVTNSLEIEEVATGADFVLLRFLNPSGEPIKGSVRLWLRGENGPASEPRTVEIGTEAGQKELLFRVPMTPGRGNAFEPGENWRTFRRIGDFRSATADVVLPERSFLSLPMDSGLFDRAVVKADGDAKVSSQATLEKGKTPPGVPLQIEAPSVKLTYRADAGWKFFRLTLKAGDRPDIESSLNKTPNSAARNAPGKCALWLYGDGKGCQARLRFTDATGQTFQSDGARIDWKGWRYVTFPLWPDEKAPLTHWGGANDGAVHYPIKWDSLFLLDNTSREPVEGEIYLSAPTLIY